MTVNISKPALNVREKLAELDKPTGVAGEAMLRAETPQEQFNLIGAGRRNLIINGDMKVAQRGTSATVSNGSNEGYSTVDRFFLNFNSNAGGAASFSQSTDAPNGLANSAKIQCSTTNTSYTGTQNVELQHRLEAQDLQQLAYGTSEAREVTLSWYMKTVNFVGPISVTFETRDGTSEYYTKSYMPTTSWQRYTLTLPPSTSATINNDNGQGMFVKFVLAGSSSGTYSKSTDSTSWSTTRADYVDDVGNILSSTSNEFYITGVQLELGKVATPFEHRSYGEELALCQRYFFKMDFPQTTTFGPAHHQTTNTMRCVVQAPQPMRTTPSINATGQPTWFVYWAGGSSNGTFNQGDKFSVVGSSLDNDRITLQATITGLYGLVGGLFGYLGDFDFDAEL